MRVLVHADDLGMSDAVNAAIGAALASGTVDSASVLATGPAFGGARATWPRGADLGVHLDYTGFPSLTGAAALDEVRELAPRDGAGAMRCLARLARAEPRVLLAEGHAQIERARTVGQLSHLDSHHHVHWQPALWPVLGRLLDEAGLRAVRAVSAWRSGVSALRAWPQALRALRFRRAFGARCPAPHFCDASSFRARIQALDVPVLEVMVHPGNPAHARYAEELIWLQGDWDGHRARFRRVSWQGLLDPGSG